MPIDENYWGQTQSSAPAPQANTGQQGASSVPAQAATSQASANQQSASYTPAPAVAPQAGAGQPGVSYASAPAPAPSSVTAQHQQKSHGWIVAIVVVVALLLLSMFAINSCNSAITSMGALGSTGGSSLDTLNEDAIAIIDISGTIQYDGGACSPEGLKELLDEAEEDDHVKGVVLRIDSGGGTATAGEEMAAYVREFSKPIVVSSASINASAAYEISSQADYIFVAKSTEIGAIGTAMQLTDLSGLLEKLGVNMETIVSADEKDSSYGYRPLTDDERAYYQEMIDQINQVFLENVAEGRSMTLDQVKELATGMPFTGITAVENGLADAIGTREDAVEKAAELAGVSDYTTTDLYFSTYDISSLAYLFSEDQSKYETLLSLLSENQGPRFK